ncbi:uncharacterized protein TRIADDRAFT_31114, partial [Trichoplax adhaerens]
EEISLADVIIWGTLYPFVDSSPASVNAKKYKSVHTWYQRLSSMDDFKTAVNEATGSKGVTAFKNYFQQAPIPSVSLSTSQSVTEDSENSVTQDEIDEAYHAWTSGRENYPKREKRPHPLLPQEGKRNILLTSALPYVNNVPHLGNIVGCVLSADAFARYCRARNYNILYICGTDEYGTATETKAVEEGVTPQQICDKYHALHAEVYKWFDISFDHFGRTTTKEQTEIAQDIFWRLQDRNYVTEENVDQLFCENCQRFLADRFVEGTCPFCTFPDARGDQCDKCGKLINAIELKAPRCKVCKSQPVIKSSKHLFLDLPKIEPQLHKYYGRPDSLTDWSPAARNITQTWLRDGVKSRCITRDLKWGTPVPLEGFTEKVFYVWYDAPIGYISITAAYTDQWEKWWKNPQNVEMYNFMAKDNVPFHSIIFPACLLAADDNYTVVNKLSATEYLNYEDGKFSKSRGIGVFGNDAKATGIPVDIWRFYLLYVRPETQDSSFSWSDLEAKNNSELLANLGNFVNRAMLFVSNFFNGEIPEMDLIEEDKVLLAQITREIRTYNNNLERTRIRDGIRNILSVSRLGNQYMQSHTPWKLVKQSEADKKRAGTVVGVCANITCLLSILLQPYMPTTSKEILSQAKLVDDYSVITDKFVCLLPAGHRIGKPKHLFEKIEPSKTEEFKTKYGGRTNATAVNFKKTETTPVANDVKELEEQVSKQGDLVRQLKADKAEKFVIQSEVQKLLELKKHLAIAKGEPVPSKDSKKKKKK